MVLVLYYFCWLGILWGVFTMICDSFGLLVSLLLLVYCLLFYCWLFVCWLDVFFCFIVNSVVYMVTILCVLVIGCLFV